MSTHPYDVLALPDQGQLIFTPCPGTKGVSLEESLAQLKSAGADAVITTMPSDEMASNGVTGLPHVCSGTGLRWFHFPLEDDSSPGEAFGEAWERGKGRVFEILDRSGTLAIHCKGGSGRTSLMAAIILCQRGMKHDLILEQVKALRPNALKLPVHTDFLQQLCTAQQRRGSAEM